MTLVKVDEIPGRHVRNSGFYDWLTHEEIQRVKKTPGQWYRCREDVPKNKSVTFAHWLRKQGLEVARRRTIPGGTQFDIYIRAEAENE